MIRSLLLLFLSILSPVGVGCESIFVHISGFAEEEFVRLVARSTETNPFNRIPWLTVELEPRLQISEGYPLETIAESVACCGLTVTETFEMLRGLADARGSIPVQTYLEKAFRWAEEKSGKPTPAHCVETALTHAHHLYSGPSKSWTNHELIEHFLAPVEDRASLSWGDTFVLRDGEGQVRHAILNLGNGIVFHKPGGMGPARIEPAASAVALYSHVADMEHWEIWRKREGDAGDILRSFAPRRRSRWRRWW